MRLRVLFTTDGCIVSLVRFAATDTRDASGRPSPQIVVEPAEGERVAVVEVDPDWDRRLLAEIHQAFRIADGPDGPYLRARESTS